MTPAFFAEDSEGLVKHLSDLRRLADALVLMTDTAPLKPFSETCLPVALCSYRLGPGTVTLEPRRLKVLMYGRE